MQRKRIVLLLFGGVVAVALIAWLSVGLMVEEGGARFRSQSDHGAIREVDDSTHRETSRSAKPVEQVAGLRADQFLPIRTTLTIRTMSDREGTPIGDVDVKVVWNTGRVDQTATDRLGTARFECRGSGGANVQVSNSGFLPQAGYYRSPGQDVYLWLTPGIPIHGRVVDSVTGSAIASAVVKVDGYDASRNQNWGQSVTTDAAGEFDIAGVTAGVAFRCVVTRDGYAPVAFQRTVSGAEHDFIVKLGGAHTLSGTVVDARGRPVRDARVFVRASDWTTRVQRADFDRLTPRCNTDRLGRFSLRGITRLPVRLVAVGDGALFGVSKLLQNAAEDRAEGATIVLHQRSLLRVSLLDSLSSPIEHARLSLEGAMALEGYGALLRDPGAPGTYSYGPLALGAYSIRVTAPGWVVRTIPVRVDAVGVNKVSITLDGGRAVKGVVVDMAGEPVAGLQVSYRGLDGEAREERTETTITGADGRFGLHGLTGRVGELVVQDPDLVRYVTEVKEVTPGGAAVRVVVRQSPRLLVRMGTGARNRSVSVVYGTVGEDAEVVGRTLSADGAGDLRFSGLPCQRAFWLTVRIGVAAPYIWKRLRLEPGGAQDLGSVDLRRRISIQGTVVDAFGNALGNAQIWASAENPDWTGTVGVRSDPTGGFRITGLPPVAHVLTVARTGYRTGSMTISFPLDEDQPVVVRLVSVEKTAK